MKTVKGYEWWKAVENFPDYEVSNCGRVRRRTPAHGTWPGRILKQRRHVRDHYPIVNLWKNRKPHTFPVYKLVAGAFLPLRPSQSHELAHSDGNNQNSHEDNLRWATSAENEADKYRHGRIVRGEKQWNARLTKDAVRSIVHRRQHGQSLTEIANIYEISRTAIHNIITGKSWNWLTKIDPTTERNVLR